VSAMSLALGSPFDVTGAAHFEDEDIPTTVVRLEGFQTSVEYRLACLQDRLSDYGDITTNVSEDGQEWQRIRDVVPLQAAQGNIWRISVKPTDAPVCLNKLQPERFMLDWGGGLIWALLPENTDARLKVGDLSGHATLVKGNGFQRFHPEPEPVAALSAGLRAKFDPRAIFNPGLMG